MNQVEQEDFDINSITSSLVASSTPANSGAASVSSNIFIRSQDNWRALTWDRTTLYGEIIMNVTALDPVTSSKRLDLKIALSQSHPLVKEAFKTAHQMMKDESVTKVARESTGKNRVIESVDDKGSKPFYSRRYKPYSQRR